MVECIRRFSPAGGPALFTADELGVGSLLLSSSDSEAVASFAEETVGELVREHSKADLLTTLCSFFENMGSIRGSAAALDVHENTIRYRLSRVEELTGLAIMHDPDAQLRARLSLLVLLLQGRLPSGIAAAARAAAERLPGGRRRWRWPRGLPARATSSSSPFGVTAAPRRTARPRGGGARLCLGTCRGSPARSRCDAPFRERVPTRAGSPTRR